MAALVIDASIASTWCFEGESTDYTDAILDAVSGPLIAAAPRLLLYKVHNTTLMGLRRLRIVQADADEFLNLFSRLSIEITDPPSYTAVFDLAPRHSLTVYDAAYLDLALRENVPIASLDRELDKAAGNAGIGVFKP